MSAPLHLPPKPVRPIVLAGVLAGLGGCVLGPQSQSAPASSGTAERTTAGASGAAAVRVIDGAELQRVAGQSTSLTEVLRGRVGSLQIRRGSQAGACPRLVLRGIKSITADPSPSIYLDGTRVNDGCILETLSPMQVRSLVIYPGGLAPDGGGYAPSPNGLILVFTYD